MATFAGQRQPVATIEKHPRDTKAGYWPKHRSGGQAERRSAAAQAKTGRVT